MARPPQTSTSSTLLDHVYRSNVVGEHKSFILVEDVSDHSPVMVCSDLSLPKSEKSTVTLIRDTKNFEVEKFLDKFTKGMELLGDIKEECIDNYTAKFIDIFHKTLNIHAPLRKQSRKETKVKNKPWLFKGSLISIQQKNLMYKRALKLNNSNTWAQYKVYRNKLIHIKEYAKRLYIKNLVNDNKHDTLSLWKIINKIIHMKNVKKNNIPNKMYASKSESAQGPQAISNLFNKYFIEIGVNLASTIETPSNVARGGGGGLQPLNWLVKYAKSHVFWAFEADFLRKMENSPPPHLKTAPLKRLNLRNWTKNQSQFWWRPFFFLEIT